ncbi:unnamed protein product [Cercospora beticola]|nr:unnamed protein product [Cercospora beticola]
MARIKNYQREEAALKEAARKELALARDEKAASKAKTKNKTTKRKDGKDKEPSYEACHKVLYCPELLEMILLNVYDPRDAFPIQPSAEVASKEKQKVKQSDAVQQSGGSSDQDRTQSTSGGENSETQYDEKEACRSMKTLLLSQRVSRMFKEMIKNSTKLQQALWFTKLFDTDASSDDDGKGPQTVVRANPLFIKKGGDAPNSLWLQHSIGHAYCGLEVQITKFTHDAESDSEASHFEEESWRYMLVAQSNKKVEYSLEVSGAGFRRGSVYMDRDYAMEAGMMRLEAIDTEREQYGEDIDLDRAWMLKRLMNGYF